ncbi:DUF2397 family protein [Nocardiopsis halophila]|uniref:DUF2397 family protein n=1 Tax=Nocardiopsis halophila TaxID=141692 RepID=UPI001F4CB248|nr:DUF2397 family protein [Nocardiopsis halophila]
MGDSAVDEAAGSGRATGRHGRAALLRLARWFDSADTARADALYAAAFAAWPARRLGGAGDETAPATGSWWNAPRAHAAPPRPAGPVPTEPAADHSAQRAALHAAAESRAHWRRAAAAEVHRALAERTEGGARIALDPAAAGVLMELLTAALGSGDPERAPVTAGDMELEVRLHAGPAPDARLTLASPDGELHLDGLWLQVTDYRTTRVPDDTPADAPAGDGPHDGPEQEPPE